MSECFIQKIECFIQKSECFIQKIQTATNAFTETLKFISTSKDFSSCFKKLALSSDQNLKYFSEHGRT